MIGENLLYQNENKRITIFVPTFNREKLLTRCYESLVRQTWKSFKLLIIDDGSTDNTKSCVDNWIKDRQIEIRYLCQQNGGKHIAYNRAIQEVDTELFVDIDSDDYLNDNALERIIHHWDKVVDKNTCCGMQLLCNDPDKNLIGNRFPSHLSYCSSFELRYNHKVTGDKCLVYRSELLKRFSLPALKERYVMESILHNRVSQLHPFILVNEPVVVKDYQQVGLSLEKIDTYMRSPGAWKILMNEANLYPLTHKQYLYFNSRYVKFALFTGDSLCTVFSMAINKRSAFVLAFIAGLFKWLKLKVKGKSVQKK